MPELHPLADEPPFRVTRASHYMLYVRDLAKSRQFYSQVVGLIESDHDQNSSYMRGIEESGHHCLVLKQSKEPKCGYAGFRVQSELDLDRAAAYFEMHGLDFQFVERPFQGRTLRVSDPTGIPLEICASMDQAPRMIADLTAHRGGAALRMDHYQISVPDPAAGQKFYAGLGFRTSDYVQDDATGDLIAVFLHRKDNPHDIVLTRRGGPLFHHAGFIVSDLASIFRACDSAGTNGYGDNVERGPGRHGLAHALFVYLRDPDGHRLELLVPPIQTADYDTPPTRWSASNGFASIAWGMPAVRRWFEEASAFEGIEQTQPPTLTTPLNLEEYLARRKGQS